MSAPTTPAQLPVGYLGFGAMRITGPEVWGPPRDEREAIVLLRRVVDRGVTFIDTADSYGPAISETLIAKALHPYPAELVVATKGGLTRPGPNRWVTDCRPDHLRRACADSLRRLRLERIELYQLHAVDHRIPIEDSIGALVDLQREGKIHYIGVSNVSERELARARAVATIISVQNCYNLRDRSSDRLIDIWPLPVSPLSLGTRWPRVVSLLQTRGSFGSPRATAPRPAKLRLPGYCSVPPPCCQFPGPPR